MDDDYFTSNMQLNSNLINTVNGEINEVAVNAIVKSNNEILLRAVEEHMQNTAQYFNNESLSDLIINIDNRRYYTHKFILAKSSDVFLTMLNNRRWLINSKCISSRMSASTNNSDECKEEQQRQQQLQFEQSQQLSESCNASNDELQQQIDEITLHETEQCTEVFEKFLKFFYTAEILITSEEVIGLLYLADKYNVNTLRNLTSQYMMIKAKSPFVKNAVDWYSYAKEFKLNDLKEVCMKTIAWNTVHVLDSDEWLNVDLEFIKDLLSDSDLVVPNEMTLYKSVSRWLLYELNDERKSSFETNCKELIPLIRFSQMLETQLYEVEKSELARNSLCGELIKQQLYKAYRFRVLEQLIVKSYSSPITSPNSASNEVAFHFTGDLHDKCYLPREYTELCVVDMVEIRNTLRVGIQVDVKTYKGPAPKKEKIADWKVLYRVHRNDINRWMLRINCGHTAIMDTINNSCKARITVIVYNDENTVLQVEHGQTFRFDTHNYYDIDLNLCYPMESKELVLLIKPVLF